MLDSTIIKLPITQSIKLVNLVSICLWILGPYFENKYVNKKYLVPLVNKAVNAKNIKLKWTNPLAIANKLKGKGVNPEINSMTINATIVLFL